MSILSSTQRLSRLLVPDLRISPSRWLQICSSWTQGQGSQPFHTSCVQASKDAARSDASTSSSGSPGASPLMRLGEVFKQTTSLQQAAKEELPLRAPRGWQWYDEADERKQQLMETQPIRGDAGYAHLMNVPQSMKKMNRILRLVRGMPLGEALAQCGLLPHKSARYVEHALSYARADAADKGVSTANLVVDLAYATKGQYMKKMAFKGRGHPTSHQQRRCHIEVELRAGSGLARGRSRSSGPPPKLLTPLTQRWQRWDETRGAHTTGSRTNPAAAIARGQL